MPHSVRAKLTAPVAIVSLLLLIIAAGAAWYIRDNQRSVSELLTRHLAGVRTAQELEINIRETRNQFARFLMTGDRKHLEPIPELKRRTEESLLAVEATGDNLNEHDLFQQIRQGYRHFFDEYDKLTRQAATQGIFQRVMELNDTIFLKEIVAPAREYSSWNDSKLNQTVEANLRLTDRLSLALLGLGLCGAFGGLLGGWVTTSAIRRNILHTEEQLRTTAVKLQQAIPTKSSGPTRPSRNPIEDVTRSASAVLSRLKRTEQQALRAEQLAWVGQMAAGIAHEVRNPLMAIKLLVQAITETRDNGSFQPKHIRILEEEIIRLEQIISTFLDYARPPRLEKKLVEIGPLVQQVVDSVRGRADIQAVKINLQSPSELIVAEIDGNQLRQVIYNLIFNALDAQPKGGLILVRISSKQGSSNQMLVIEVEDQGQGLPKQLGDHIFEPFVSTKPSGLGLGLSICRRIVEGHGGKIRAANRKKGGAIFSLRLPLSQVAAQQSKEHVAFAAN